jgi:hypothetical protein
MNGNESQAACGPDNHSRSSDRAVHTARRAQSWVDVRSNGELRSHHLTKADAVNRGRGQAKFDRADQFVHRKESRARGRQQLRAPVMCVPSATLIAR